MSRQGSVTYPLHILQDHVYLSVARSNRAIAAPSTVAFGALVAAGFGSGSTGKDLGSLTTPVNVPQIVSPVLAAWLLAASGNDHRALFAAAIAFVVAGSLLVLRSARGVSRAGPTGRGRSRAWRSLFSLPGRSIGERRHFSD